MDFHREKRKNIAGRLVALLLALMFILPSYSLMRGADAGTGDNVATPHIVINEVCYNGVDPYAGWIELYNPTSTPVDITNWHLWFYYLNGPVRISQLTHGKPVILKAHGYLILCGKESNFTRWWGNPPTGTQIIEQGIGPFNDTIHLDDENWSVVDSVYWGKGDQLPPLPQNHSWARYRGGYDTDNFTNDFYDEASPTPGYENHRAKDSISSYPSHIVINEVCYNGGDPEAGWVELYNPTSTPVNITRWNLWLCCINCPITIGFLSHGKPVILKAHGYLILCGKESNFTRWWGNPPRGTQIIEQAVASLNYGLELADEKAWDVVDSVYSGKGGQLPPLPQNHSWARYRGGYDTDNFTNDFYDEPHPTPGYENHRVKGSQGPMDEKTELSFFIGSAVMALLIASVIWVRYRRRK